MKLLIPALIVLAFAGRALAGPAASPTRLSDEEIVSLSPTDKKAFETELEQANDDENRVKQIIAKYRVKAQENKNKIQFQPSGAAAQAKCATGSETERAHCMENAKLGIDETAPTLAEDSEEKRRRIREEAAKGRKPQNTFKAETKLQLEAASPKGANVDSKTVIGGLKFGVVAGLAGMILTGGGLLPFLLLGLLGFAAGMLITHMLNK
ncbi:MAG: hypothetical protein HY549_12980 [Elusimicrobia bacterium]|nr:hypothetical protein [Elusimicrobiota bacterium]